MEQFIEKDLQKLDILAAVRSEKIVELTLGRVEEQVEDKSDVIEELLMSTKVKKDGEVLVQEYITKYIAHLVRDTMVVTEYVEKSKSKQMVLFFIDTHWATIETQLYYVFVKRCARKLGLSPIYSESPEFMNKVFERLAFRVMEHKKHFVTPGESWINLLNCTLEIKNDGTVVKREHRAEDFFTYCLPYVYDPRAECPMFQKFLDRVLPEKEMQTLLAEYIGYCFTSNLKLEKMAVFYGVGCNGKSVMLDVVTSLLGSMNVSYITLSDLTTNDEKRSLANGKLANISSESKGELDTAVLKRMVSNEETDMRKLYVGTKLMTHIPKLFTSYNRLPPAEYTHGFFRRWLLFPFKVTIPEEEQDVDLVKKLCTELPGILNWVLAGLKNVLVRKSFSKSEGCRIALHEYISNSNSAMMFFSHSCEVDNSCFIKLTDLYKLYSTYCLEEDVKKIGKKNFQEIIISFGAEASYRDHIKYYNLRMKENADN